MYMKNKYSLQKLNTNSELICTVHTRHTQVIVYSFSYNMYIIDAQYFVQFSFLNNFQPKYTIFYSKIRTLHIICVYRHTLHIVRYFLEANKSFQVINRAQLHIFF